MPLRIIRADITRLDVDAIVNAANSSMLGGGGVDGAIHQAAGPRLLQECRGLGGCHVGQAKMTAGYDLPARHVIHTVGPVWHGGSHDEARLLAACYTSSLQLAAASGLHTVAFPLISAGIYGYPRRQALDVAVGAIDAFLQQHDDMEVTLALYDSTDILPPELRKAIDRLLAQDEPSDDAGLVQLNRIRCKAGSMARPAADIPAPDFDAQLDESFSQMVLRKIDETGMTDSECYRRANIDRRLFSKIRSRADYRPSKTTAVALAVALRLDGAQTAELLAKAGLALSRSNRADIIVSWFIAQGDYDINRINKVLYSYDQPLLGA